MKEPFEDRVSGSCDGGTGGTNGGLAPGLPVTEIAVEDPDTLRKVLGPQCRNLRHVAAAFGALAGTRGDRIQLQGGDDAVAQARRCLLQLLELAATGVPLRAQEVEQAVSLVSQ